MIHACIFYRWIHSLFYTNAVWHLDISSRSPDIFKCSPHIWVVGWEMRLLADLWVPGDHNLCVIALSWKSICDSSVSLLHISWVLCMWVHLSIFPHRMQTLWGKWWLLFILFLLPDIHWMNKWVNEVPNHDFYTYELKVVPCTEKKHNEQ